MEKWLFVDVDGVLNDDFTTSRSVNGWCFVDADKVRRLARIQRETGCKLILSSDWREGLYMPLGDPAARDVYQLLQYCALHNVYFDDMTAPIRPHTDRADEILNYLPPFDQARDLVWVALDDDYTINTFDDEHRVRTVNREGLTEEKMMEVMSKLCRKDS